MGIAINRWFRGTPAWRRLRASPLYEVYLWIFRRDLLRERKEEVAFYSEVLKGFRPGGLIFDVGANEGHKTAVFLAMGARVICVEPDVQNVAHLRNRYRWTRRVTIVPKAVSNEIGRVVFNVFEDGSPLNTLSSKWVETLGDPTKSRFRTQLTAHDAYEVETTTLDQIAEEEGQAFYVKIDVEGYEVKAIEGMTNKVNYLSFELNLPEFRNEGLQCIEHLKRIDPAVRFNWAIDNKLESKVWLGAEAFFEWLKATQIRYIEVYARYQ